MKSFLLIGLMLNYITVFAQIPVKPEAAASIVVTDVYHGVSIEDPYRYMENLNDPKVLNWLKSNTQYANHVLNNIPEKDNLKAKIRDLDSRTSSRIFNVQITGDGSYFYLKMTSEDESGKLFVRNGYDGSEKLLLDPSKYKESKESYTILDYSPNKNGDKVAVRLAANGSENGEVLLLDKNGTRLEEPLELIEFYSWLGADDIAYTKFRSADVLATGRQLNKKIYLHIKGTLQTQDLDYFSSEKNPDLHITPEEVPIMYYDKDLDQSFALVTTVNPAVEIYMAEGSNTSPKSWKLLAAPEDKVTRFVSTKDAIYYLSLKDAANFKIVKSSIQNPEFSKGTVVVAESETGPIEKLTTTSEGLFYTIIANGVEGKLFFLPNEEETPKEIELPFTAGFVEPSSKGSSSSDLWVQLSGWTSPHQRFKYDITNKAFKSEPLSTSADYPELENLITKQVMIPSHDGVEVPVSLIYRKDLKLDGNNPALIYGYGAYGVIAGPFFSPAFLAYTLYDGVLVVSHVRGGGELGEDWHKAGQKLNKANTWKDAIATAEYLIKEGYTAPDKLSIMGGSAGGIMVGRAITERPDLFAAAIPLVGGMNMVRQEESPEGPVNVPEFGTVKDAEEFKALLEMDSFHQLVDKTHYPAALITSGMNDPRVIAWVPAKFAARMQAANASDKPILLLTDFDGGHGIGNERSKIFEEFANIFSFSFWQSGHPKFQPLKE